MSHNAVLAAYLSWPKSLVPAQGCHKCAMHHPVRGEACAGNCTGLPTSKWALHNDELCWPIPSSVRVSWEEVEGKLLAIGAGWLEGFPGDKQVMGTGWDLALILDPVLRTEQSNWRLLWSVQNCATKNIGIAPSRPIGGAAVPERLCTKSQISNVNKFTYIRDSTYINIQSILETDVGDYKSCARA